jgi:hypothetical protein
METRGWLVPRVLPGRYSPIGAGRRLVRLSNGGRYEAGPWAFSGVMPHYWMPDRYPNFGDEELPAAEAIVSAFAKSRDAGYAEARRADAAGRSGNVWWRTARSYIGYRAYTEPELTESIDRLRAAGNVKLADLLTVRRRIVRDALKEQRTPELAVGGLYDYAHHGVPRWISTWGFGITVVGIIAGVVAARSRRGA